MKFGKSAAEAEAEPSRSEGSGDFMRYLKAGDTTIQLVDEPDAWVYYWEHFNPDGYAYPCTNERDTCPGCTSDNERVSKASRKIAFNALQEYDGKLYLNVWKVPKTVADKLKMRFERNGTVTDRPFLITQFKKDNGFFDYDVEGQDKQSPEYEKDHWRDPEELLAAAYDDAWGTSAKAKQTSAKATQSQREADLGSKLGKSKIQPTEPPSWAKEEPKVEVEEITEDELRKMEFFDLVDFCKKNGFKNPQGDNVDEIVDWMLTQ